MTWINFESIFLLLDGTAPDYEFDKKTYKYVYSRTITFIEATPIDAQVRKVTIPKHRVFHQTNKSKHDIKPSFYFYPYCFSS